MYFIKSGSDKHCEEKESMVKRQEFKVTDHRARAGVEPRTPLIIQWTFKRGAEIPIIKTSM